MSMNSEIVRCSQGAYYESLWVPLISFKSIRLGSYRLQKCPVHGKWELATIVPEDEISEKVRKEASKYPAKRLI
jgi:hypothetical protein